MGFHWSGYTGDTAGLAVGRRPYVALIGTTVWDGDHWIGAGTFDSAVIAGQTVYPNIWVNILTPGARMAIVTGVDMTDGPLQLEVAPLELADSGEDWAPGVHLFGFAVGHGGQQTETTATVVVPKSKLKKAIRFSSASLRTIMRVRRPNALG